MHRLAAAVCCLVPLLLAAARPALAGPPFLTDDPVPVPAHDYEAYLFGTMDRSGGGSAWQGPAFEFNAGLPPSLQVHVVVPVAYVTPPGNVGPGDVELGVKYRFVAEGHFRPQIGTFPMLELPTGSARPRPRQRHGLGEESPCGCRRARGSGQSTAARGTR